MPFTLTQASATALVQDAYRVVGDVTALLRGVTTDPRVTQAAKVEASAALAYLVSGRGRIPSFVPVAGRLDELAVAAFAVRRLLAAAGEPVLRSHWRGSARGLDAVLAFTTALAAPGGRWRRMAVAGAATSFVRDRLGSKSPAAARGQGSVQPPRPRSVRPGAGRVVEGEVLARRESRR